MRRSATAHNPGVSLFPFLAVLICTMGVMMLLLVICNRPGIDGDDKDANASARESDADAAKGVVSWRITQLETARAKTEADLADRRLRLSAVEEHMGQLREEWNSLRVAAKDLAQAEHAKGEAARLSEAQLAQLRQQLELAKGDVAKAVERRRSEGPSFAIVPYEGPNGTRRRPLYIECSHDRVTIQPEGVVLTIEDFEGPAGPGNPLATILRATRDYLAAQGAAGGAQGEPYPLLIVRPDGIELFYGARAAMESWASEFGYELIEQDRKLVYPPPNPQLARVEQTALADARARYAWFAQTRTARKQAEAERPVYRASTTGGGIVRVDHGGQGAGVGGQGSGVRDGETDGAGRSAGGGSHGYDPLAPRGNPAVAMGNANGIGGQGSVIPSQGSGFGNQGVGSGPQGSVGGGYGSGNGAHGYDPFAPPLAAGGGDGRPGGGPYGPNAGRPSGNAPGTTGVGTGIAGGPSNGNLGPGMSATGPANLAGMPGNVSGNVYNANGAQITGSYTGNAAAGSPPNGNFAGGPANSSSTGGDLARGQQSPNGIPDGSAMTAVGSEGSPGGGGAGPGGDGSGSGTYTGMPSGFNMAVNSPPTDRHSVYDDRPPTAAARPQQPGPGEFVDSVHYTPEKPKPEDSDPTKKAHSLADERGRNWSLPSAAKQSVPVSRPIHIECRGDRLVILPDAGNAEPQVVMFAGRTEDSVDKLVAGVWAHTKGWGIAGRQMYWRPSLVLELGPSGEGRFSELQALMANSGLEIVRK